MMTCCDKTFDETATVSFRGNMQDAGRLGLGTAVSHLISLQYLPFGIVAPVELISRHSGKSGCNQARETHLDL